VPVMPSEPSDAPRAADVPEDKARTAAEAVAAHRVDVLPVPITRRRDPPPKASSTSSGIGAKKPPGTSNDPSRAPAGLRADGSLL
jgi:hypothetical protein